MSMFAHGCADMILRSFEDVFKKLPAVLAAGEALLPPHGAIVA